MPGPTTPQPPPLDIAGTVRKAHMHWNAGQADQAEMLCQQVLAVWPGHSDATHLMGLMAHAYGNLDLAIEHLRRACQAPRTPAVYHINLAEMCSKRGLMGEAEEMARRAVSLDPRQGGGWNNLGIILQEGGKLAESRQCLERALALEPENAQAFNNLGNTCKRLGLMEDAERCWSRAIALRPDYAEVYSNLAHVLTERSDYGRARELARKAIELNPRLADAYINLAGVEAAVQAYPEALRWLRALLDFAPDHAGGLVALAQTLKTLDEPEAAADAARQAVALMPQSAEAHDALGVALQAMGEDSAALAAFERAATLPGTTREKVLLNRAALHLEFGRLDAAEAGYREALTEFPRSTSGFFNLTSARRLPPGDPMIDRMRAMLETGPDLPPTARMQLNFGLGKAFLDAGDSAEAFRYLDEGNRLKRASISYDPDGVSRWMREIADAFPASDLAAEAADADTGVQPVFVLGMPRSGTTLVEQILASHPAVHGGGELRHMQQLVDSLGAFPAAASGLTAERTAELVSGYLAKVRPLAGPGQRYVVDKMPANFLYIGVIRRILPHARIIHCRRDPVDTCLSCYSQLFAGEQSFSYNQAELGRFHRDYQTLMAHWRPGFPASHVIEVDYEAVVDDLEREARRLIAFLNLPWDEACLSFHRTERPIRTASVTQVRQPIYRHAAGRWRKHAAELGPLLAALEASTA
jgi:tetratricopeptide (TPR) repeat protein